MNPSIGTRVYSLLSANAAVAARVATRIYPLIAPQTAAVPRIVYTNVDESHIRSLQGYTSGLIRDRVQVDCYAKTYAESETMADEVTDAFASLPAVTLSPSRVGRASLYEDETQLFRVTMDFLLWITGA